MDLETLGKTEGTITRDQSQRALKPVGATLFDCGVVAMKYALGTWARGA
jgi:hypothetical protein